MDNRTRRRRLWIVLAMGGLLLGLGCTATQTHKGGQPAGEIEGIAGVVVERETLTIDLQPLAECKPVQVTAIYRMRYEGEESKARISLVVHMSRREGLLEQVRFNGKPLVRSFAEQKDVHPDWLPFRHTPGLREHPDPIDFNPGRHVRHVVVTYEVQLKAGLHDLEVRYGVEACAFSDKAPARFWLLGFDFSPMQRWKKVGRLDLAVHLPPDWDVAHTLPLKRDGDVLTGRFERVPDEPLTLTTQVTYHDFAGKNILFWWAVVGGAGIGMSWLFGVAAGIYHCWRQHSMSWIWPECILIATAWLVLQLAGPFVLESCFQIPESQHPWTDNGLSRAIGVFLALLLSLFAFPAGLIVAPATAWVVRNVLGFLVFDTRTVNEYAANARESGPVNAKPGASKPGASETGIQATPRERPDGGQIQARRP